MSSLAQPDQHFSKHIRSLQAGTQHQLDTFHLFPRLPIELRIEIWTLSLPGPQIYSPKNNFYDFELKVSQSKNPGALQASQESREIGLRRYTPREHSYLAFARKRDKINYASYIDFARDRVVFPSIESFSLIQGYQVNDYTEEEWEGRHFSRTELSKVANLQIISDDFYYAEMQIRSVLKVWLPTFASLKNFTFTILLQPAVKDVYQSWEGERLSVKEELARYNGVARKLMEVIRGKQLANGVVCEVVNTKVEAVNMTEDECLTNTFELR